jgi:RND superfamily putative drug exporter
MLVFPQDVIKSLAAGAIASVIGAAFFSLTAIPAALAVLGKRIDSLTWRKGAADRAEERAHRMWGGVVTWVMKRPIVVAVGIVAVLLVFASPLSQIKLGSITYTALPQGDPARTAMQTLVDVFPTTGNGATVLRQSTTSDDRAPLLQASEIQREAEALPGVASSLVRGAFGNYAVVAANYAEGTNDEQQQDIVKALRALPTPDGATVMVGGGQASTMDSNAAIIRGLPYMLTIMIASTLILLFLAFGSVVLPVKAVLMAGISLAATFGLLTFIFQMGHGTSLLGVSPNPLEPTFVVLIVAVIFGLSTDYEVFLLSRMVEAHGAGATTEESVKFGAQHTGRIVTAAAILLALVTGAFAISGLSIMRLLGVGMIIALLLDATIVRMLLVPSLVKLMGPVNWWAPAWMKKVYSKVGIGH